MGRSFSYSANDASVGDVDGDGEYEIILKWQPSNAKNPPQTGFTGNQIIDCYKLNGTRLWRIDLGKKELERIARQLGLIFIYARTFHPAMKHFAAVSKKKKQRR